MVSYYDLRAAQNAMKALQNRSLNSRNLDIHYSFPKVSSYLVTSRVSIIPFPLLTSICLKTVFLLFVLCTSFVQLLCIPIFHFMVIEISQLDDMLGKCFREGYWPWYTDDIWS
jgi:hypothetical protein